MRKLHNQGKWARNHSVLPDLNIALLHTLNFAMNQVWLKSLRKMAANIPRFLPFVDWDEWISVKNSLFSSESREISTALEMVSLWRVRGKLPLSIDSTAQLVELRLRDSPSADKRSAYHSENELKLLYSAVVVRSVNGLVDPSQQGIYATSVLTLAERMGLPGWIVELRHDATHNQMPSLGVLRNAANTLTSWYFNNYWQPQMSLLESLTVSCLPVQPPPAAVVSAHAKAKAPTSVSVSEPAESTQQQDSSPTFVTEIFMPIFLGGVVHTAPSVPPSPETDFASLVAEETARQRKFWHARVKDLLRSNSYAAYSLLYGLLGAAKEALEQSRRHDIETYRAEWALDMVLFWVADVASMAFAGRAGASSGNVSVVALSSSQFMHALLVTIQDLAVDAKKSLPSKAGELVRLVSASCSVDMSLPKVSTESVLKSQKKRKLGEEVNEGRQSIGSAKNTDSITRLTNFPVWPLGCVPGCLNPGLLHQIEEVL